ncbi:MAG: tRNA pseudouridine(38-40) synthase TruA [Candidatus Nanopelagicales bacterium]|nr:tRNA pseudouridine(38-40) synthase TruA [Candidatus Nanopelagicales bacterium]
MPEAATKQRWRLDISYNGAGFHGWAGQPGLRTVEHTIDEALAIIGRGAARSNGVVPRGDRAWDGSEFIGRVVCAGRTDAGVHARGQVAHVDIDPRLSAVMKPDWVRYRLAGLLSDDVAVHEVRIVEHTFDARFSALFRRYAYRICDDPSTVDALRRHEVTRHHRRLDLDAMNEAADALIGEHDFVAFCKPRPGRTTVRHLLTCRWTRDCAGHAVLDISADAFCHSMVRTITGALVAVGEGRASPSWVARTLSGGYRDPQLRVMPAQGLTLEEVAYPPEERWADRQIVTRTVRATALVAPAATPTLGPR